jgi:succinate dehydrogenase / fumarate reductase cytochrome b subunit
VAWLQGLNYLNFLEIVLIGLPLLWHALYGVVIIAGGRAEPLRYPYLHNRLYLLQRISGLGILLFLVIHVGGTRIWGIWEPGIKADMFGHIQSQLQNPLILGLYLAGLLLAVFHLCYGIWSLAVSWGITTTPRAQKLMFKVVMVLALLLAVEGIHGIRGFLL